MKKLIISGVCIIVMSLQLSACQRVDPFKLHAPDSDVKDFSPLLYEEGEVFPEFYEGTEWDPALWPASYQDKDNFTRQLFSSRIIHDQYIKKDRFSEAVTSDLFAGLYDVDQYQSIERIDGPGIPILVVGPNFYHLSATDQYRVTNALDQLYGATRGEYGGFILQDYYTREMIGSYTNAGLSMK